MFFSAASALKMSGFSSLQVRTVQASRAAPSAIARPTSSARNGSRNLTCKPCTALLRQARQLARVVQRTHYDRAVVIGKANVENSAHGELLRQRQPPRWSCHAWPAFFPRCRRNRSPRGCRCPAPSAAGKIPTNQQAVVAHVKAPPPTMLRGQNADGADASPGPRRPIRARTFWACRCPARF